MNFSENRVEEKGGCVFRMFDRPYGPFMFTGAQFTSLPVLSISNP